MPKIKLRLSIGFLTAVLTETDYIDDDYWNEMNENEREKYLDELAQDWANNFIDISAEVEE